MLVANPHDTPNSKGKKDYKMRGKAKMKETKSQFKSESKSTRASVAKKFLALGLVLMLTLTMGITLTGCGDSDNGSSDAGSEASDVTYAIGLGESLTDSQEFKSDDGSVLYESMSYELPQLAITANDGSTTTYLDLTEAANSSDSEIAEMAKICTAFNNEMAGVAAEFETAGQSGAADAEEYYHNIISAEERDYWTNFADEISIRSTYQTDGGLLSIVCDTYSAAGGAHPLAATRVWNFDLTTGEFIDYDDLTDGDADLSTALTNTLADAVLAQIDEQGLAGELYEGYEDLVYNLPEDALIYFEEGNIIAYFDKYSIAPYAAGPQIFDIPLDTVKDCLSAHMQELLDLE